MAYLLLVPFVLALASLAARGAGEVLGCLWERRCRAEDVHPWALHAPAFALALPLAGLLVGLLAFVPSVPWTWLSGLCACQAYGGIHVCPLHPEPALELLAPLGLLALIVLLSRARALVAFALRLRDLVHLASEAELDSSGMATLDLGGRPIVFVAGLLRPTVFVEKRWWASLPERERTVIDAHERAHVSAGDPRVFAALELLLALFAPRARARIVADWQLVAELRADAAAAAEDGDPLFVAEVLCRHTRAAAPSGALSLGGRALSVRIGALIDGSVLVPMRWSVGARVGALLGLLSSGHLVHRALEWALRLLL